MTEWPAVERVTVRGRCYWRGGTMRWYRTRREARRAERVYLSNLRRFSKRLQSFISRQSLEVDWDDLPRM